MNLFIHKKGVTDISITINAIRQQQYQNLMKKTVNGKIFQKIAIIKLKIKFTQKRQSWFRLQSIIVLV